MGALARERSWAIPQKTTPVEGVSVHAHESLSSQLHGSYTYDCSAGTTFRFEVALDKG